MIGLPLASTRLPASKPVRPGLPSLKMITPEAPAALAFRTFTPKKQLPRWISAMRPGVKPAKSPLVQPLDEEGDGVGGMMIPPAGCKAALLATPVLRPGFQSVAST